MNKLKMLLDKLKQGQNYCPYCGGEYSCDGDCILRGIWFEHQNDKYKAELDENE